MSVVDRVMEGPIRYWNGMPETDRDVVGFLENALLNHCEKQLMPIDEALRDCTGMSPQGRKSLEAERKYVKRNRARANHILRWLHKMARENGGNLPRDEDRS